MKQQMLLTKIGILPILLIVIVLLSACNKNVQSTDLSGIELDGMKVGDIAEWEHFSKYTYISRNHYEEITLDTDAEDCIVYLFSYFLGNKYPGVTISINGNQNSETIDDITNLLGNYYTEQQEPNQKNLSRHIYYDAENKIKAEFIYDKDEKALCYIRLLADSTPYE